MTRLAFLLAAAACLAACNSADQQKVDMQVCSGYGFKPGTSDYANCMMQTAQQRQAQQAASQLQQSYNNMVAQQAQKDRDAQAPAQQAQQDAAHQAEIQRMMNSSSPSFIPTSASSGSGVTTPTIPSIDTSNMHCVSQTAGNAGTMSCTN
jgi:hypothetical protein